MVLGFGWTVRTRTRNQKLETRNQKLAQTKIALRERDLDIVLSK